MGWGVLARAEYEMNLDRQLPNSVDINIAPSTGVRTFQLQGGTGAAGAQRGETFAVPVYAQRVSASFGPVTDVESNANATYSGLTLEARRGMGSGRSGYGGVGRGLEFRVAWTWSKAIDFGQNAGAVPRTNGQFDPFTVRYDKGLSALDFPHRVVAMAVWSPRLSGEPAVPTAAERALWKLADGWSLAGIFSEASGRGYSYDVFGGTRLAGGRESINGSGGSVALPTVGRNTLRLPDSANLDVRLSRSFRLSEGLRLRGALEAFNVMNHQNISGVTQRAFLVGTPAPEQWDHRAGGNAAGLSGCSDGGDRGAERAAVRRVYGGGNQPGAGASGAGGSAAGVLRAFTRPVKAPRGPPVGRYRTEHPASRRVYFFGMARGNSRVPALLAMMSKRPACSVSWPCGRSMGRESLIGARRKLLYCAGLMVILKAWLRAATSWLKES